jgi:hypothetical protein
MKKVLLFIICLSVLVFALVGVSQAWQGRMGGMGDAYGLVADESDFLIHPAKIAKGEGVRFYGDYRFIYTGVTNWDYHLNQFNAAGILTDYYHFDTSGYEHTHDALLGAAFSLGSGRMGIFFDYDGTKSIYDGNEVQRTTVSYFYYKYELTQDLDNFVLRLLYGLPVGNFNLGGEIQFAYCQEENESKFYRRDLPIVLLNYPYGGAIAAYNLFPFMLPHDSDYWETVLKGSIEGMVGPADVVFTLRGSFIFSGDNEWEEAQHWPVTPDSRFKLDGDVKGWHIGGDLWVRYPLTDDIVLPFLVRVEYHEKTWDGDGPGGAFPTFAGNDYNYKSNERDLQIELGGGIVKELAAGTSIAVGIYYNYLQPKYDLRLRGITPAQARWSVYDYSDYPSLTAHRIILKIAGEREFSPSIALRFGLDFYYGWAKEDFEFTRTTDPLFLGDDYTDDISLDGHLWGIGISLGGTLKFQRFAIEPFINAGYQELNLDGDGDRVNVVSGLTNLWGMDKSRSEWSVGGGLSILFGL